MTDSTVEICYTCGKSASYACNGCKSVFYCTRDCQKASWISNHKAECPRSDKAAPAAVSKKPVEDINYLLNYILGITSSFAWKNTFFGFNAFDEKCIVIETQTGAGWERDCYADGVDRENIHQMIDDYKVHEWSTDEVEYPDTNDNLLQVFFTIPSTDELKDYLIRLDSDELNQHDLDEIVSAIDDANYVDYMPPNNDNDY